MSETENLTIQDRWAREQAETHAKHVALYEGIAAHLPGWKAVIKPSNVHDGAYKYTLQADIAMSGNRKQTPRIHITFETGAQRGKIRVSGYWPQRSNHGPYTMPSEVGEDSPSIGLSLTTSLTGMERGYDALARQIQNRFIPNYLRIFDKLLAKIDEDNDYKARKLANWKKLTDAGLVIDRTRPQDDGDQRGDARVRGSDGVTNLDAGYGDVRMTGENSVEIHLRSLPTDTAMRVLRALKGEALPCVHDYEYTTYPAGKCRKCGAHD